MTKALLITGVGNNSTMVVDEAGKSYVIPLRRYATGRPEAVRTFTERANAVAKLAKKAAARKA